MRVRSWLLPLAVLVTARAAAAQCSDGTPPPCSVARANRPPDPNRMLIVPFRVSTTDTLLGEGFAELLAAEFTREGMPKAVDMATTLSSWRAAGGHLRAPLTREAATRLARSLGAGVVSEGSIVGLGKQITITVALVNSTNNQPRTATLRINGSADSLEVALKRTTSAMMGALAPGGAAMAPQGGQYTSSPEAMQAYLEGLAFIRRGQTNDAARKFDRAIALDSNFAQAVYRRAQAATWQATGPSVEFYEPLEWKLRDRLAAGERLIIEALHAGSAQDIGRALDHAAAILPDSPEVLYQAGDQWYHFGSFIDPTIQLQRARAYFARSVEIDSQPLVLGHLVEIGMITFDTALVRSALRAYRQRTSDSSLFPRKWFGAAAIGDHATLASLRSEGLLARTTTPVAGLAFYADIPITTFDEFFDRWAREIPPERGPALNRFRSLVLASRGRPQAAMRIREALSATSRNLLDLELAVLAAGGLPTASIPIDDIVRRAVPDPQLRADSSNLEERCALMLLKRAAETSADSAFVRTDRCGWALGLLGLPYDGSAATLGRIERADSLMQQGFIRSYEPYVVARAWEANGKTARALRAIRYGILSSGSGVSYHPWTLAYEGRLAAQVGDTAGAVSAYRKWLGMMRDAEPPFAETRDSVRAELARLLRK